MATESEFLSAIEAQPDDETLRLVYADWLDEQGDSRAAGVRARCGEVARLVGKLNLLRAIDLPDAGGRACRFAGPLTTAEVVAYEERHRIRLPPEYRDILLQIGGGGGPAAEAFSPLPEITPAWVPTASFDRGENSHMVAVNGAIPLRASAALALAVNGPYAGGVWSSGGHRYYFVSTVFQWFEDWLDSLLERHKGLLRERVVQGDGERVVAAIVQTLPHFSDCRELCRWLMTLGLLGDRARAAIPTLDRFTTVDRGPVRGVMIRSLHAYTVIRFARKALSDINADRRGPFPPRSDNDLEDYIRGFEG